MDTTQPRPLYLLELAALSATGRATRSGVATEAMLADCRTCPCWREGAGCVLFTSHAFAVLLADGERSCDRR